MGMGYGVVRLVYRSRQVWGGVDIIILEVKGGNSGWLLDLEG